MEEGWRKRLIQDNIWKPEERSEGASHAHMGQGNFQAKGITSTKALRSSLLGVFVEQWRGQHGTKQVRGGVFGDEEKDVMAVGGQLGTQGFMDNFKDAGFYSKLEFTDMLWLML